MSRAKRAACRVGEMQIESYLTTPTSAFASLGRPSPQGGGIDRYLDHHPNQSVLRGRSTVLTFSSLIVPLAIRSLMSPSVVPEIFER
jgi:hypothetical protein